MSLDQLIDRDRASQSGGHALVLLGGGARTAYQAGVLSGLARLLARRGDEPARFPFRIMVGTSAGALNAAYLASQSGAGLAAFERLAAFWHELHSSQVYRLAIPSWLPANLLLAVLTLVRQIRRYRALLDTMPLVDTLHRQINLGAIETALQQGALDALAITASSYNSGEHWTFCQTRTDHPLQPWRRPGRHASLQPITIEHLMASSAIPFLFPAVPLWVDGRKEFFGDGSMRQLTPLSPALHLGASRVLVIGVGQPRRADLLGRRKSGDDPGAGTIAGHALASVFHDTLQADVEQAQRVSATLASLPPELAAALPYRPVQVLALQPTRSLDELALQHVGALPPATRHTLEGIGALETHPGDRRAAAGSAAALASYLMFEPAFTRTLIEWGEHDALAREAELLDFFKRAEP